MGFLIYLQTSKCEANTPVSTPQPVALNLTSKFDWFVIYKHGEDEVLYWHLSTCCSGGMSDFLTITLFVT